MYYKTTACPACGEDASTCIARPAAWRDSSSARKCCTSCRHDERRIEHPEPQQLPLRDAPSTPMSPAELDVAVEALLERAADDDGVELGGQVNVSAYRSLAKSRGVSLEEVVRHAIRDELADVVAIPPLHT